MAQQIQQADKALIRDLTEEAIVNGLGERERRKLRAELADSLSVARRSLGSVSAYVEYSATQALEATGLAGRLKNVQLITAARLVRGSASPADDVRALANEFGLNEQELATTIGVYEGLYQGRPGGVLDSDADARVAAPVPHDGQCVVTLGGNSLSTEAESGGSSSSEPQPLAAQPRDTLEMDPDADDVAGAGGDLTDYDFPAKREWRRQWANFIASHYGPARLRDAHVVCLPGRQVEFEVSQYLALGVRPENIHCVEKSPRVREEFLRNAARLGVKAYPMSLDTALERFERAGLKFSIVNYDFHGQFCATHQRALGTVPLAGDAVVIYNALAKREGAEAKEQLAGEVLATTDWHAQMAEVILADEGNQSLMRRLARPLSAAESGSVGERGFLDAARRFQVPLLVARYAGIATRQLDRALYHDILAAFGTVDSTAVFQAEAEQVAQTMADWALPLRMLAPAGITLAMAGVRNRYGGRVLNDADARTFGLFLWHRMTNEPCTVGRPAVYEYLSEAKPGRAPSRFVTTLARVVQADAILPGHDEVVRYGKETVLEIFRLFHAQSAGGRPERPKRYAFDVTDRAGKVRPPNSPLRWDDRIVTLHQDGRRTAVEVGKLNAAMVAARTLEQKQRFQL